MRIDGKNTVRHPACRKPSVDLLTEGELAEIDRQVEDIVAGREPPQAKKIQRAEIVQPKSSGISAYGITKEDFLKTLDANEWKILRTRTELKLPRNLSTLEIFQQFDCLGEIKNKFMERLRQRLFVLNDIAIDLDISHSEAVNLTLLCKEEIKKIPGNPVSPLIENINPISLDANMTACNSFFWGTPLDSLKKLYKHKVIELWSTNKLDVRKLARFVGAQDDLPLIRIFQHYGMVDYLKDTICLNLARHKYDAHLTAEKVFQISTEEFKELSDHCQIVLPSLFSEDDIRKIIKDELEKLFEQNVEYIATKFPYNIKVILWGIASTRLQGTYDPKKLKKLIDDHIQIIVDDVVEKGKGAKPIQQLPEPETSCSDEPVVLDSETVSQEEISNYAKKLDSALEKEIIDKGIRELVESQAYDFLRRLQEAQLFKELTSLDPKFSSASEAVKEVKKLIDQEKGILKKVLEDLLKDFEEIAGGNGELSLEEKLFKLGLKKLQGERLYLYQLIGISRMAKAKKCVLGDEMGLGKTLQGLCTFLLSGKDELVVLGPKSALVRWMEDIAKYTNLKLEVCLLANESPHEDLRKCRQIKVRTFKDTDERLNYFVGQRKKPKEGKRVLMMNYDILPQLDDLIRERNIKSVPVDFLALDEVHLLKNPKTTWASSVFGNGRKYIGMISDYKLLITGTPVENTSSDVLGYLRYISLMENGNGTDFPLAPDACLAPTLAVSNAARLFAEVDRRVLKTIFRDSDLSMMSLLHSHLSSRMIRRLKDDVLTGLPVKKFTVVKLDPLSGTMIINDKEVVKLGGDYHTQFYFYDQVLRNPEQFERVFASKVPQPGDNEEELEEVVSKCTQILRLEQLALDPAIFGIHCDSIKYDALKALITPRFEAGKSIVVFNNYKTVARNVREILAPMFGDDEVAYIDGDVVNRYTDLARTREVNRFQNEQSHILDATIGTMGLSGNLTQADCMMILNYAWKPSVINQGTDRAHRIDRLRNYVGKELEIVFFEIVHPISIDRLKAGVLRRKEIIGEMIVKGDLTREVLSAFDRADDRVIEVVKNTSDYQMPLRRYELTIQNRLRLIMDEIMQTENPARIAELFDEAAPFYALFIEQKSTFYGNMANLDCLADKNKYPQLSGRDLIALDLASGPSVMDHANEKKKKELNEKGFNLSKVDELEISTLMSALGSNKKGQKFIGTFRDLAKFKADTYDIVNLSHAWRYVEHPGDLVENIHRVLKEGGVFTGIFPRATIITQKFADVFTNAGFEVMEGPGKMLRSRLDLDTYNNLLVYGEEVADDIAKKAEATFTYFSAVKRGPINVKPTDEDLTVMRKVPYNVTEGKIKGTLGPSNIPMETPEGGIVEGQVIQAQDEDLKGPDTYALSKDYRWILKKLSDIDGLAIKSVFSKRKDRKSEEIKTQASETLKRKLHLIVDYLGSGISILDSTQRADLVRKLSDMQRVPLIRDGLLIHEDLVKEVENLLRRKRD